MNGCSREFSLKARAGRVAVGLLGAGCLALAASAASAEPGGYPSFATVPALPKDVRSVAAWRSAVVDTRLTGARLAGAAAKEPWTLGDTVGWAARERNEAAPPPAVTAPTEPDVEALVKAMKARASQPSRRR